MGDVATNEWRTVLFVSHNMNAVEELCESCILLEGGRIKNQGSSVRSNISSYLFENALEMEKSEWINTGNELNNPWFKPLKFCFSDSNGESISMPIRNNEEVWITLTGEVTNSDPALQVGYAIFDHNGSLLYWSCHTDSSEKDWPLLSRGKNTVRSRFPNRILNQGNYRLELIVLLYYRQWICEPGKNSPAINLSIQGGLSDSPYWMDQRPGMLAPVRTWENVAEDLYDKFRDNK
jgi:lipopolysaccharide transport system ATP-binding protein